MFDDDGMNSKCWRLLRVLITLLSLPLSLSLSLSLSPSLSLSLSLSLSRANAHSERARAARRRRPGWRHVRATWTSTLTSKLKSVRSWRVWRSLSMPCSIRSAHDSRISDEAQKLKREAQKRATLRPLPCKLHNVSVACLFACLPASQPVYLSLLHIPCPPFFDLFLPFLSILLRPFLTRSLDDTCMT